MFKKLKDFPRFINEVKGELKKVNWSSREELISATVIVIAAVAFLTIYISCIDMFLAKIIRYFLR